MSEDLGETGLTPEEGEVGPVPTWSPAGPDTWDPHCVSMDRVQGMVSAGSAWSQLRKAGPFSAADFSCVICHLEQGTQKPRSETSSAPGFSPLISWWFCFPHNSERVRQICQIVSLMAPSGGQQVGTGGWTLATAKNRAINLAVTGGGGSLRSRDGHGGLDCSGPSEPVPSKKWRNQCCQT